MGITNRINFRNVRGDLFGGVTAAVIALPMALAFGVASGAGAASGLYGAVIVGFFAALFGGTPTLISEPTGPMTVVFTAVIAQLIASDPENGMAMAFTVAMLAGLFQIIFGVLKLGRYVTLMPYPVISGFMSGIGIILIILQLGPFLGHATPRGGVVGTLTSLPGMVSTLDPAEVALGVFALAVLFLMPKRFGRWVPPQLLVLVVGTLLALTVFAGADLRLIGEIPTGLPSLQLPVFGADQLRVMLVDGLVLGMLGCIDALLTAMIADSITRTQHDSNKELIGQGIGNLMSGLFGGMPGAGATMGTVVNIQAGGRTALSGLVRAGILLVVVLWAAPLTREIPLAVLAGIAVKVGFDILDWSFLKRAHQVSWKGTAIMYGVMFLTVFVDLIVAVGVGVFIANVLTIERLTKLQSDQVKAITDFDEDVPMTAEDKALIDQANGRVLMFHLSGPMIFGVARAISQEHTAMDAHDVLIVDLQDVPHLGVTAALALENAIQDASDAGRPVFLAGARGKTLSRLEKLGALRFVPPEHLLENRTEALKAALRLLAAKDGVEPPGLAVEPGTATL
ncbi:SulP family inorganic anion transporter [Nodosilinea sp. PGN35]|uniref:bicarbonate transporter BicA n=1 Tax=Nodosilinea sp. PGN35 TaxID=3020489 RepID=UPI0023B2A998|nr:SulP family inorganic anion transporter [Nodosilinea sp. TSF1-S3]MDF0367244.1 SulP family inorganic anion transporter [Nodosilinea sp. TSF1-S3]